MATSTSIWQWVSAVFAILAVASLCAAFVFWRRARNPTRERFAFWSVGAMIALAISCIAMMFGRQLPFVPLINAFAKAFKLDFAISETPPSLTEYAFVFLVFFLLVRLIGQIHSTWNGPVSIADHERQQKALNNGLIVGAAHELKRRLRRDPVKVWNTSNNASGDNALGNANDSMAWYEQAAELLLLSSPSYHIDLGTGWRDKPGVWLGYSMDGDVQLALIPTEPETRIETLKETLAWVNRNKVDDHTEIHIAVRGDNYSHFSELASQAKLHTEIDLLSNLVNWADYRAFIYRRFKIELLPESSHSLSDTYVHPKVQYAEKDGSPVDLESELEEWLKEKSGRQLALLGEYGMGKSTSALAITHRLLSLKAPVRTPILIELRGKSPRNQQPLEILGAWSAPFRISARALMRLHSAGRLLLIFEGFDEMALIGDSEMRIKHFTSIWSFCFPNAKILITGRPNFFLDQIELKRSLGIGRPDGARAYCEALRLCPFELDQIQAALQCQNASVREQIISVANRNQRFRELISRPSILHVAASLWEKENLLAKADRLTAADLMDLFVRSSYRRQGLKEDSLSSEFMALTEREREYFMSGIAAFMMQQRLPNQISKRDLDDLIERLIEKMPDAVTAEVGAMSNNTRCLLRERLAASEYGTDHVKTDVRTCGLLVDDPSSPGMFRFGHKSILEFLFGSIWYQLTERDNAAISRSLRAALQLGVIRLRRSHEACRFFGELLIASVEREIGNEKENPAKMADRVWSEVARRVLGLWDVSKTVFKLAQINFLFLEATFRVLPRFLGGRRSILWGFVRSVSGEEVDEKPSVRNQRRAIALYRRMMALSAFGIGGVWLFSWWFGRWNIDPHSFSAVVQNSGTWGLAFVIIFQLSMAVSVITSGGFISVVRLAARIGVPLHVLESVAMGPLWRLLPKLPKDQTDEAAETIEK